MACFRLAIGSFYAIIQKRPQARRKVCLQGEEQTFEFTSNVTRRGGPLLIYGVLAHPVERFHGMEEVSSSSLLYSTIACVYL